MPQVTLSRRRADDFTGLDEGYFDAVILSSVVQYFPSVEYLLEVLEGCFQVLRPGGFIFFGDVRHYGLLEAFHASLELARNGPERAAGDLRQRIRRQMQRETELALDPQIFPALRDRFPAIRQVRIRLQRGRAHNELTKYRYHAMLHTQDASQNSNDLVWMRGGSLPAIRAHLKAGNPVSAAWTGLLNARLQEDLRADAADAIDPEDLWTLGAELGYQVEICWSDGSPWHFDAVFTRGSHGPVQMPLISRRAATRHWNQYANQPLREAVFTQLVPELRKHLEARLPEYMIPSAIVILEELPLTANGKVDRRALPRPEMAQPVPDGTSDDGAERYALEKPLTALFSELLGIDHVRLEDSFFSLGGHSLLAYRLVSKIRDRMQIQVPLHVLFSHPSVAGLARWIQDHAAGEDAPASLPCYVVALQPFGNKRPVFFFPPAAGVSTCYSGLAQAMEPDRPLYGFQSPGALDAGKPLRSVERMASLYADALIAIQREGPYCICGWSFGGVLACAVAKELESRGKRASLLALFDGGVRDASRMSGLQKLRDAFALLPKLVKAVWDVCPSCYADFRQLGQWVGISLPESPRGLIRGNPASQFRLIRNFLAGSRRSLRVSFANTRAGLAYAPPAYEGKAVLFRTRLSERAPDDPLIAGVRGFARGGVEVHAAPGSHMTLMLDPRNATEVGKLLQECISRAESAELSGHASEYARAAAD